MTLRFLFRHASPKKELEHEPKGGSDLSDAYYYGVKGFVACVGVVIIVG